MMLDLDRKVVKTDICEECSTLDLNEKVTDLIEVMYEEIDFDRLELPYDELKTLYLECTLPKEEAEDQ